MPERLKKVVQKSHKVNHHFNLSFCDKIKKKNVAIIFVEQLTVSNIFEISKKIFIMYVSFQPYIWLSCNGANNVDKDHIGEIEYIPTPGFPVEYFPFTGQLDYMSPIVALKFNSLTCKL